MSGTILLGGLGIVAAILCFLFWKLSQEIDGGSRYPLQVVVFFFLLGIILLIGKVSVDYKDNCEWLLNNTVIVGNTTNYNHTYQCNTNTNGSQSIFYTITLWIFRITSAYLFFTFAFEAINYFAWRKKGGGK